MKNFLLILLGKGTIEESAKDIFKSECYYDWIKLKNIAGSSDKSPEDLLAASYDEEIKERQKVITHNTRIQQGIIAIPADDTEEDEIEYNKFLKEINKTSIIFVSFISIPVWSKNERKRIFGAAEENANRQIKKEILRIIDKTSMRLFYTFDHNDLAIICDGKKKDLKEYLEILKKIRAITYTAKKQESNEEQEVEKYPAVHDITTIYGYKNSANSKSPINAVVSVSGQDVVFDDAVNSKQSFTMEAIGRYDHISEYNGITWGKLAKMSNALHGENVITSRVHIGVSYPEISDDNYSNKSSTLFDNFKSVYENKIDAIKFDKLKRLYNDDAKYIDSIKIMLYEIGFGIDTTLRRGFSKYNGVCYIESYLCFLDYIKEKIVDKYCRLANRIKRIKNDEKKVQKSAELNVEIGKLPENLVDISNYFYKSILTLDSSIMHSERRFVMSDPYQLSLFDVPPKLIAYYTAVASKMAQALNINSDNRYVFLITPDIKSDIYVESITDNTDIGSEVNILVIHINERNIYNVTETTKCLAHEIAHHVGQDVDLRRSRATYFAKCFIALLLIRSLDKELLTLNFEIDRIFISLTKIVEEIYEMIYKPKLAKILKDPEKYYYMDSLQNNIYSTLIISLVNNKDKLYEIIKRNLSLNVIRSYAVESKISFVDSDNPKNEDSPIYRDYIRSKILKNALKRLHKYLEETDILKKDVMCIRFIFKEGYADMQMIQLTQSLNQDKDAIVKDYEMSLEGALHKSDEIMRKCAVVNAYTSKDDYSDLWKNRMDDPNFYKAYLKFICKQASCYFSEVKSKSTNTVELDRTFDCSKTSLFKSSNLSDIIDCMDSTIESYAESILKLK